MTTLNTLTQVFKALGEPVRLRIIHLLLQRPSLCVCDLVVILTVGQSTISRHLAYLKNAGIVTAYREGTWMHYRLLTENLDTLNQTQLQEIFKNLPETQADLTNLITYEKHPRNCPLQP